VGSGGARPREGWPATSKGAACTATAACCPAAKPARKPGEEAAAASGVAAAAAAGEPAQEMGEERVADAGDDSRAARRDEGASHGLQMLPSGWPPKSWAGSGGAGVEELTAWASLVLLALLGPSGEQVSRELRKPASLHGTHSSAASKSAVLVFKTSLSSVASSTLTPIGGRHSMSGLSEHSSAQASCRRFSRRRCRRWPEPSSRGDRGGDGRAGWGGGASPPGCG